MEGLQREGDVDRPPSGDNVVNHPLNIDRFANVHHGHLGARLPQGVGESATYALPSARHVGHLSVEAHSIEDGAPLDSAENLVVRYFTL
ncbi:hypothetical protein EYF80_030174 [Liparis tanakae]|uniref:Uncharacterized protein n=1 Tax=Liparis tanakae TaxID=230148 RepID=A0A4Z2H3Y7_9TELE|nr:hypothetical protein EYF80_030174 [Liparis tanakae]